MQLGAVDSNLLTECATSRQQQVACLDGP